MSPGTPLLLPSPIRSTAQAGGAGGGGSPVVGGPWFEGWNNNTAGDEDTDTSCNICMDRLPEAILLECGHGGLCLQCAHQLWDQTGEGRLCPMCRKPITGIVKIIGESGGEVTVEVMHYSMASSAEALQRAPSGSSLRRWFGGHRADVFNSQLNSSAHSLGPVLEVRNSNSTPRMHPLLPSPRVSPAASGGAHNPPETGPPPPPQAPQQHIMA